MRFIRVFFAFSLLAALLSCNDDEENSFSASSIIEGTVVKVAAQTGGQILKMNFEEGEKIDAGQTIAVVDTEKLVYQIDQIAAGLSEIGIQKQINLNTLEKAQSDFANIKKKYERFQDLYEKNSTSKQNLDDMSTAYDAARTQLQNVKQAIQLAEAKEKGLLAQKNLLRSQIEDASVIAPVSGILTTKYFETGETVAPGFAIAEITDLSEVWTKIYVSEMLLPKINTGDKVEVYIDGTQKTLTGAVSWISPKSEFTPKNILTDETRTSLVYAIKVTIDNPDNVLKHGMPVKVKLNL